MAITPCELNKKRMRVHRLSVRVLTCQSDEDLDWWNLQFFRTLVMKVVIESRGLAKFGLWGRGYRIEHHSSLTRPSKAITTKYLICHLPIFCSFFRNTFVLHCAKCFPCHILFLLYVPHTSSLVVLSFPMTCLSWPVFCSLMTSVSQNHP